MAVVVSVEVSSLDSTLIRDSGLVLLLVLVKDVLVIVKFPLE